MKKRLNSIILVGGAKTFRNENYGEFSGKLCQPIKNPIQYVNNMLSMYIYYIYYYNIILYLYPQKIQKLFLMSFLHTFR